MYILHLKTQRGQPYGSERRCCERCGQMIWMDDLPEGHEYTTEETLYENPPPGSVRCGDVPKEKR